MRRHLACIRQQRDGPRIDSLDKPENLKIIETRVEIGGVEKNPAVRENGLEAGFDVARLFGIEFDLLKRP